MSKDVTRHETKDNVRYLTVFSNRQARAAILGSKTIGPPACVTEICIANPRHHARGGNVLDEFVVDGVVASLLAKVDSPILPRFNFAAFYVSSPFRRRAKVADYGVDLLRRPSQENRSRSNVILRQSRADQRNDSDEQSQPGHYTDDNFNQQLHSCPSFSAIRYLTRSKVVERRVGMIEPPVEPVVFEHKNLLQLTSSERSGDRFAFEVPGAAGFGIDQLERVVRRFVIFLSKELQPPPVNRSLERAHRAIVFT